MYPLEKRQFKKHSVFLSNRPPLQTDRFETYASTRSCIYKREHHQQPQKQQRRRRRRRHRHSYANKCASECVWIVSARCLYAHKAAAEEIKKKKKINSQTEKKHAITESALFRITFQMRANKM